MTRQQRWQTKQHILGNCRICGKKAINASHCEFHKNEANKRKKLARRKRYGLPIGPKYDSMDFRGKCRGRIKPNEA